MRPTVHAPPLALSAASPAAAVPCWLSRRGKRKEARVGGAAAGEGEGVDEEEYTKRGVGEAVLLPLPNRPRNLEEDKEEEKFGGLLCEEGRLRASGSYSASCRLSARKRNSISMECTSMCKTLKCRSSNTTGWTACSEDATTSRSANVLVLTALKASLGGGGDLLKESALLYSPCIRSICNNTTWLLSQGSSRRKRQALFKGLSCSQYWTRNVCEQ